MATKNENKKTWYHRRHNYDVGIRHGDHKNSGYDEYRLTTNVKSVSKSIS